MNSSIGVDLNQDPDLFSSDRDSCASSSDERTGEGPQQVQERADQRGCRIGGGPEQPQASGAKGPAFHEFCQRLGAERFSTAQYATRFKTRWGRREKPMVLGRGSFATIEQHRDLHKDEFVAVKIPKPDVEQSLGDELILSCLCGNSPNVTQCVGYLHEDVDSFSPQSLVFERCDESLQAYWKQMCGLLPPRVRHSCVKGLCRGLMHLHSKVVAHLDLSMANCVLQWGVDGLLLKVTDFGSARCAVGAGVDAVVSGLGSADVNANEVWTVGDEFNMVCTWTYRAPEISLGLPFGLAADLWSAGVITRQLFTGRCLYELLDEDPSPFEYAQMHVGRATDAQWPGVETAPFYQAWRGEPDNWSTTRFAAPVDTRALDFARKLLAIPPSSRLTANEACREFFLFGQGPCRLKRKRSAWTQEAPRPPPLLEPPAAPAPAARPSEAQQATASTCECRGGCFSCAAFGHPGTQCGQPVEGDSAFCATCRCRYCDKVAHKGPVCYGHQWQLAPTEYKAARAFAPTFNCMEAIDVTAYVAHALLEYAVPATIQAQMWCPVAVGHFAAGIVAKKSLARTPRGVMDLF